MERYGLILVVAFVVDLLMGDPRWLWHPVRAIGALIAGLEPVLRKAFPATKHGERLAGLVLVVLVCTVSTGLTWGLLFAWEQAVGTAVAWALEVLICAMMLATRSLYSESMAVYKALVKRDLPGARHAVSMIVGRDTAQLDEAGVSRATVETVAENFSDGVLAPMLFILIGGAPGVVFYKAVNTMDSMVGYQNDRYQYVGTAAAKLDDLLNYAPARIGGLLLAMLAPLSGLDGKRALTVFFRDRNNHKSPNSAHTEAAVAGALGVQLGGNGYYGGKLVEKPTIGDDLRAIDPVDIVKTNKLMLAAAFACVAIVAVAVL